MKPALEQLKYKPKLLYEQQGVPSKYKSKNILLEK